MIPDSHAHLDLIEADTGSVLDGARRNGVSPVITIGIDLDSSAEAVRLAEAFESVFAAVGLHPNDTSGQPPGAFEALEELARSSGMVVAIGETGLDYYRERSPAPVQKEAFRLHVRLARRLGKPLVVHDREAHNDVLDVLEEEGAGDVPTVLHCFSGDPAMMEECMKRGYFVSFAGPITFKKSEKAREAAAAARIDRLLVETDSPFLSPDPFRGKANLPERARLVADRLALLRGLSTEEMDAVLMENTARVFGTRIAEAAR